MSINPSSDLVLDVIKAGDPARAEAVNERLESLSATSSPDEAGFAQALEASAPPAAAPEMVVAAGARARLQGLTSTKAAERYKEKQARINFEASILGSFMQELMPKDDSSVYGQGFAGDMWRSMLADQMARQIATSGVLGISQKLFSTHGLLHNGHAPASHGGPRVETHDSVVSQNALSLPNNVTLDSDASYLFLPRKPT